MEAAETRPKGNKKRQAHVETHELPYCPKCGTQLKPAHWTWRCDKCNKQWGQDDWHLIGIET